MIVSFLLMCGVFGYVGEYRADLSDFIISSLKKLEYRGYDSTGIVVLNGKPKFAKEVGEISKLKKLMSGKVFDGSVGIGHTRWATHGGVTRANAHPHADCKKEIFVVHNGILENYEDIKKTLIKKGHKFISQTDTEVFSHLVEENLKSSRDFVEAVRKSFNVVHGLNAFVCVTKDEIVAFRRGSPLVVGLGEKANYISSDLPGLSAITTKIIIFEDNEGVVVRKDTVEIINAKSGKVKKPKVQVVSNLECDVDKGSFNHFLEKEIYEEPEVVARIANYDKGQITFAASLIKKAFGTYFTACGTAANAGLAATYMFSQIANRHVNFAVGSEFPFLQNFLVSKSLLIVGSQSGETMDTLEAVKAAKAHKSRILSLVNVDGSTLTRVSDSTLLLKAGTERAVVSTKAYVAKLSVFLLLAYAVAGKFNEGVTDLKRVSKDLSKMLDKAFTVNLKKLAKKLQRAEHIYLIGRGINYPTALEGALKIKEASYIHAEGFAGGELKHGVIALIEKGTPCIVIVSDDETRESVLSNAAEVGARGAFVVGISPKNESVFDYHIKVPASRYGSPIINTIPLQLLAYYLALLKKVNPDRPRNLAKSVTVK